MANKMICLFIVSILVLTKFDPDETVLSKRITALHKVLRDINGKEAQVAVNGTVI